MRAFAVGLWKEWRDHRLISVALLVALPVIVFASAWAFGDEVLPADFGGLSLFALCTAQALYVFAVASEAFGGERRRGTLDFLRRLPRGLGRAFVAKLAMYVLGSACSLLWGAFVAWLACRWFGPDRAVGDFARALLLPDPMIAVVTTAVFALGLWTLLVSNMVPQGGAATVGAAILLGLLGLPVFLGLKDYPWLLGVIGPELLIPASLALAVPALLALTYAFLRGNRLLSNAWAPSWRAFAVVGVIACGGYAWGAVERTRALTIDPHQEDFRIEQAFLGTNGRHLFLTVYRGPYAYFNSYSTGPDAGGPHQPWVVDLESGTWRVAGGFYEGWQSLLWNGPRVRQPIVKRLAYASNQVGWFDGATGELRKVAPNDVRTPELIEWERASMPALAWHKDADGRALWMEGEHMLHAGETAPFQRWVAGYALPWTAFLPDGWCLPTYAKPEVGGASTPVWRLWEAATGKSWTAERRHLSSYQEVLLSTKSALFCDYVDTPKGRRTGLGPWTLVDLASGLETPTQKAPATDRLLSAWAGERALILDGADRTQLTLSLWDPRSGESQPVRDEKGASFVGTSAEVVATAPGRLLVVTVRTVREHPYTQAFVLIDERTGHARRLPVSDSRSIVVCIENEDAVVMLLNHERVVRFTYSTKWVGREPAFGVETLFPTRR